MAKLVIGVHLFFVLLLEVLESVELLGLEKIPDVFHRHQFRAFIFRALDDVVPAEDVFPQVPLHAILAEVVLAELLAVEVGNEVADTAQYFLGWVVVDGPFHHIFDIMAGLNGQFVVVFFHSH